MAKQIEIKVRGYHLDGFLHVNNARYLEFLEEARWSFFEEKKLLEALLQSGHDFTAVNININYRKASLMHDILLIETRMKRINHRSAILRQEIKNKRNGALIADADITFVLVNQRTQKAAELKGELLELLEGMSG